ncbi:hypothetical protein AB9M75_06170 [Lactobacillus sp. AN1001]
MKNIKRNKKFYSLLHQLEEIDIEWYLHVGEEERLNKYADYGDPTIDPFIVVKERILLKKLREVLKADDRSYRKEEQQLVVRLHVTYYQLFDLGWHEISDLMGIPINTLRKNYPPLSEDDLLKKDQKLFDAFRKIKCSSNL